MERALFLKFLIRSKFNFKRAYEYYKTYDKILKLGLFDKAFYLKNYPNVEKSGMDPLEHFLFYGCEEGKYPGPFFNIHSYMEENPKIKINPLVHYVLENSKGHIFTNSPVKTVKERLIQTNSLFLHNYTFKEEPLVSIIVLNRNGSKHLKRLFKDFDVKAHYNHYEIIVVDNDSSDDSIDVLKGLSKILPITIIENKENVSFSKGNNDAAKIANGDYLLLLNNDIEPTYGWLNEMMGTMLSNKNVGAVGAKLVFPYEYNRKHKVKSFSIQHAGVKFHEANNPYVYSPYHENMFFNQIFDKKVNETKECISNTAAALLIPKKIYFELDGLDEDYFYGYEDIDFAFKLFINNYKSIYCASAMLFHHESATRLKDEKAEKINFKNIMRFKNKWNDVLFKNFLKNKIKHEKFFTNKKLAITIFSEDYNTEY
ncbi:glycosyltransferase, partial [Methanobrevibacter sp. OttesenSCG-928-I08]|nr:glycosyltransferase [Methanobrevibacter sp. OttesenSCG-928-I08]